MCVCVCLCVCVFVCVCDVGGLLWTWADVGEVVCGGWGWLWWVLLAGGSSKWTGGLVGIAGGWVG